MAEWEYLTINELAALLQLNPQTVRNWINGGQLESIKVGRGRRIPRRAVVALTGGDGWEIPELLTVAQVAELLRLNQQTVRNWIDDGKLPAIVIGERRVRIKQTVIDEVLAKGLTGLPLEPPAPTAIDFWLGNSPVGEPVPREAAVRS